METKQQHEPKQKLDARLIADAAKDFPVLYTQMQDYEKQMKDLAEMASSTVDQVKSLTKELRRPEEKRDAARESLWETMKSTLVNAGAVTEYEWDNAELSFGSGGHIVSSGECTHKDEPGEDHPLARLLSKITGGRASVEVEQIKVNRDEQTTH